MMILEIEIISLTKIKSFYVELLKDPSTLQAKKTALIKFIHFIQQTKMKPKQVVNFPKLY